MSGHNKWSKVKHKKAAADQKKSMAYSKYLAGISAAARENPNPENNVRLKSLVEQAKKANVPNETIERALRKAAEQKDLKPFTFEAYGPEGVAIIVEAYTDNGNRTGQELRGIAHKHNAKIADTGSVLWAFEKDQTLNTWAPKFPQEISQENYALLETIVSDFENQPDVESVTTSAKESKENEDAR